MDVDTKDACLKEKEVEYETKLAEISQLRLEIEQAETTKAAEEQLCEQVSKMKEHCAVVEEHLRVEKELVAELKIQLQVCMLQLLIRMMMDCSWSVALKHVQHLLQVIGSIYRPGHWIVCEAFACDFISALTIVLVGYAGGCGHEGRLFERKRSGV